MSEEAHIRIHHSLEDGSTLTECVSGSMPKNRTGQLRNSTKGNLRKKIDHETNKVRYTAVIGGTRKEEWADFEELD